MALWALAACGGETALLVEIQAPFEVPGEVDQLEIDAVGLSSGGMLSQRFVIEAAFPHSFAIRPGESDSEEVTVTVTARKRTGPDMPVGELVTARTVVDRFVPGEVRTVRVVLERACVGVVCEDDETCMDGMCVEVRRDAGMDSGTDAGQLDGGEERDAPVDSGRDGGFDAHFDAGDPCGPTGGMCEGWLTCGADGCVNTSRDGRHCGSCGRACGSRQGCNAGACADCGVADTVCAGQCISITSHPLHCGGCGSACPPHQNCDGSSCVLANPGDRCGRPLDIGGLVGMQMFTPPKNLLPDVTPPCYDDHFKDGIALLWTAPAAGRYRFTAQTMGGSEAALQLFAGTDRSCVCPLPGGCAASDSSTTVSVDRAVGAGERLLIVAGSGKQIDSVLLTVAAL